MWRQIPSVKPPPGKRKNREEHVEREEERTVKRITYVTAWRFIEKWRIDKAGQPRSWLKYDPHSNTMSCSLCRQHAKEKQKQNPFISGTTNMKLESVKDHERSRCRTDCLKASQPVSSTPVV